MIGSTFGNLLWFKIFIAFKAFNNFTDIHPRLQPSHFALRGITMGLYGLIGPKGTLCPNDEYPFPLLGNTVIQRASFHNLIFIAFLIDYFQKTLDDSLISGVKKAFDILEYKTIRL